MVLSSLGCGVDSTGRCTQSLIGSYVASADVHGADHDWLLLLLIALLARVVASLSPSWRHASVFSLA